jgi:hypothetical protein
MRAMAWCARRHWKVVARGFWVVTYRTATAPALRAGRAALESIVFGIWRWRGDSIDAQYREQSSVQRRS